VFFFDKKFNLGCNEANNLDNNFLRGDL